MIASIIPLLLALAQDLPVLTGLIKTIESWFVVTPATQEQNVSVAIQAEQKQIDQTGRPQ
jgi:hypothetical protein